MKNLIIVLLALLSYSLNYSQDLKECEKTVPILVSAISEGSASSISEYLSPEFTVAGQSGELAKMILNQLLQQLNDRVSDYKKIEEELIGETLKLSYEFDYQNMGKKQTLLSFNKANQIVELSLFEMEVKVMDQNKEVIKSEKSQLTIPFKLAGNLISVAVELNGKKRNFLLDTGSPTVVLNAKYYKNKMPEGSTQISNAKGVNGAIAGMDIFEIDNLNFSGIQLNNEAVISMNLAHLEEELNTEIYGLIGYDLIKDYDLLFDYENQVLTLIEPEVFSSYKNNELKNYDSETIALEMNEHIPSIELSIGKQTYRMGIDSGAEINLFDDDLMPSLKSFIKEVETDRLSGAGSNSSAVISCNISSTKIGESNYLNLPTVFSDISHLNDGYNISLDGLIGYQILSKQKCLISFQRKEFTFFDLKE